MRKIVHLYIYAILQYQSRQYRDKLGILHSMFAILGHTDKMKIYTLYFFKYDYTLKKWDEERKRISQYLAMKEIRYIKPGNVIEVK